MDKFKRYLGLLFSISLLVFFLPHPNQLNTGYQFGTLYPERINFLDRTGVTRLALIKSPDWHLWRFATGFLDSCVRAENPNAKYARTPVCDTLGELIFYRRTLFKDNAEALMRAQPMIRDKFTALQSLDWGLKGQGLNDLAKEELRSEITKEIYRLIGVAVVERLDVIRPKLNVTIYALNLALLMMILLGICYRQAIGNALWLPFSLFGRMLFKAGAKAKDIHDKI